MNGSSVPKILFCFLFFVLLVFATAEAYQQGIRDGHAQVYAASKTQQVIPIEDPGPTQARLVATELRMALNEVNRLNRQVESLQSQLSQCQGSPMLAGE